MKISIVIPILNEKRIIEESLSVLAETLVQARRRTDGEWEVIVSDGGSSDGCDRTAQILAETHRWVFTQESFSSPSVGKTVHNGVKRASGEVVLILPCDSYLNPACLVELSDAIKFRSADCGAFYKEYSPSTWTLRFYQNAQNKIRLDLLKHSVWTNGIFFRKNLLSTVSFPEDGFLEDVALSDYLRKSSGWICLRTPLKISSRRYYPDRVLRRIFVNALIMIFHRFHLAGPAQLKKWYLKIK